MNRKLRAVVRHEFMTIIRQPSFWIALIAFPLITGVILLIGALTDNKENIQLNDVQDINIAVIDDSGLIKEDIAASYEINLEDNSQRDSLEDSVKLGQLDGLIVYPDTLAETGKYEMFADNSDKDYAKVVSELGRILLQQSLLAPIESDQLAALALSGGEGNMQAYTKGEPQRDIAEYIVPGAFLILFYVVLIFSVGYALSTVSEEKENRSIEMVLSYVKPQTLIVGKLLAIILVTLTQILFIGMIAAVAYLIARSLGNDLSLPFSISDLTFVPAEIGIGIGFLILGFIFYVGLMAMVGAIFPSTKEANGFSTIFYLLPAVPFWGMSAITDQASSMFQQILTYFPLTSPTTVLLRNAAGNLSLSEGLISLAVLAVSTLLIISVAAKAFRLGTLEYTDRIKLGSLISK